LRADTAEPPLPLDEVLANARQTAAGMFVVPRVVDG
jgi:Asp-tRNA(Asn)/Glu-tRNA(Gln) amidotransferase C subunit